MAYLVGAGLAIAVGCFARLSGFDRDRAFYPTVAMVVATYYLLFAAMGNAMGALAWESMGACVFFTAAVAGFRKNLWIAVAALAGHGLFDAIHGRIIENPGVPVWWPGFCLSFDVAAAAFLALLLRRRLGFTPA